MCRIYPVWVVGWEDVCFNHAKHRWGANFSTVEIGKARIRAFFASLGVRVVEFKGYETAELREKYGYRKTKDKAANRFEAHCSDSLALACEVGEGKRVEPGLFGVVDDTYRPVRRRLHDRQPAAGGQREPYSRGTVFGYRKGLLIEAANGLSGLLCGEYKGGFRYYAVAGLRRVTKKLIWVSTDFVMKRRPALPRPSNAKRMDGVPAPEI
jgi:hypothetical protein